MHIHIITSYILHVYIYVYSQIRTVKTGCGWILLFGGVKVSCFNCFRRLKCQGKIEDKWRWGKKSVSLYVRDRPVTHRNILQHTASHFNKMQRNSLRHTATFCDILQQNATQLIATHCDILQHTATHCDTLQHTTTHYNTLQHTAAHCSTPVREIALVVICTPTFVHLFHEQLHLAHMPRDAARFCL